MANLRDIKEQMIGMNPNNEDWKDWVKRQKRVDNLTNDDGVYMVIQKCTT